MIKIEKTEVLGWEAAIRGMRNPKNSWEKSDSNFSCRTCEGCVWEQDANVEEDEREKLSWCSHSPCRIGENDLKLMKTLAKAGSDHGKFLRMINVTCDITAPLYWWKEFDTYKVGTVANSCSTMHKIAAKEFTLDDFSHEHLWDTALMHLEDTIKILNIWRDAFNTPTPDAVYKKQCWWQMIQLLPSSYNQRRTVQLNYEVLRAMDRPGRRKDHRLDEWREFCKWAEALPYFKAICISED